MIIQIVCCLHYAQCSASFFFTRNPLPNGKMKSGINSSETQGASNALIKITKHKRGKQFGLVHGSLFFFQI